MEKKSTVSKIIETSRHKLFKYYQDEKVVRVRSKCPACKNEPFKDLNDDDRLTLSLSHSIEIKCSFCNRVFEAWE